MPDAPCPFCDFDEPDVTVYADELVYAIVSRAPINRFHVLVIPRGHVERLPELSAEVAAAVINAAQQVSRALVAAAQPDGVTYVTDDDLTDQGYNLVPHWKLHVIARFNDEAVRIDWAREPDPGAAERANIAASIRQYMPMST